MVGFGLSSAAKPVSITFRLRSAQRRAHRRRAALRAAHHPQTRIFRRWHGSGAAVRRLSAGAESALTGCTQNALIAVRNLRIALPSTSITAPTSAAMKILLLTTLSCLAHAGKKTVRKRVPTTPRRRRPPAPTANYTLSAKVSSAVDCRPRARAATRRRARAGRVSGRFSFRRARGTASLVAAVSLRWSEL